MTYVTERIRHSGGRGRERGGSGLDRGKDRSAKDENSWLVAEPCLGHLECNEVELRQQAIDTFSLAPGMDVVVDMVDKINEQKDDKKGSYLLQCYCYFCCCLSSHDVASKIATLLQSKGIQGLLQLQDRLAYCLLLSQ